MPYQNPLAKWLLLDREPKCHCHLNVPKNRTSRLGRFSVFRKSKRQFTGQVQFFGTM